MSRHPAAAAALAAVAMLAASCTTNPGGGTSAPTQTVTVTLPPPPSSGAPVITPTEQPTDVLPSETATVLVTPTPEPTKTEIDVVAPAPAEDLVANRQQVFCPKGTHEGCHTYEDMETYLTHILALVSPMFDQLYGSANRPSHFYYIATGQVGTTACPAPGNTLAPYDSSSYLYCGIDQAIYTGQDSLWLYYAGLGDAAPAVAYAHEWGHHIQNIMEVPRPRTPQEQVPRENQADCIAGAWVNYAHKSGYLEYPTDLGDISRLMQTIASAESNIYRTHGTLEERVYALQYGYYYGLPGCNQYFPNTPIFNG